MQKFKVDLKKKNRGLHFFFLERVQILTFDLFISFFPLISIYGSVSFIAKANPICITLTDISSHQVGLSQGFYTPLRLCYMVKFSGAGAGAGGANHV